MCFVFAGPTISPTNLPVSPVTLDTIVPAVLLGVFTVLGFLAIFILLFIVLCLYNRKTDLEVEKKTMELKLTNKEDQIRNLDERNRELNTEKGNLQHRIKSLEDRNRELDIEKGDLQRQISSATTASDVDGYSDSPVGLQFVKVAMEIRNLCSHNACSDKVYLNAVTSIMQSMSDNYSDKRFRDLVRGVRDSALKLYDTLSDEERQHISEPIDCGDSKVCFDDVPDLDSAKAQFTLYLEKLDAIIETEG